MQCLVSLYLALALASSTSTASELWSRTDTSCSAVHVFLARGNNEPYPGRQGKLIAAICSGLQSCDYEDIQYYNPLPAPYCGSVIEGAANGIKQITAYNERCPDAKLVVSGYSQGAHVVGDILAGAGGVFFEGCVQPNSAGLNPEQAPANKIAAALIFGDVRHTSGQSYNVLGGSDGNGLFPRPGDQLANLNAFSGILRDYCATQDPICAGGDVVDEHLNYFDIYSEDAAAWVKQMLKIDQDESATTSPPRPTSTIKTSSIVETSAPTKSSLPSSRSETEKQETKTRTEENNDVIPSATTALNESPTSEATSSDVPSTTARITSTSGAASEGATETRTIAPPGSEEPTATTESNTAESTTSATGEPNDPDNAASTQKVDLKVAILFLLGLMAL
ncbi:Acetylxylan esterase 2 [Paramyrothecium foliicola]|nr:Acetylxylan esterase 2 [Paramyrothecium foliicola]